MSVCIVVALVSLYSLQCRLEASRSDVGSTQGIQGKPQKTRDGGAADFQ